MTKYLIFRRLRRAIAQVILCEAFDRVQNFKLLDGASDSSNPPSRRSSPSHLGRKVLILAHFSVIRLPKIGVAA